MPKIKRVPSIKNFYIGIDPGKAGGLVLLNGHAEILHADPMPETESDICDWFKTTCFVYGPLGKIVASVEKVSAFPGMGMVACFTFGEGYGGLLMALIAMKIPFETVRPQVWQKALEIPKRKPNSKIEKVLIKQGKDKGKLKLKKSGGETTTEWKKRLRSKAQKLFPEAASEITLKTADAILIAEYCRRKHEGLLG